RAGSTAWADSSGDNLWLFGGELGGPLNDLWKYTISTGQWTWMSGESNGYGIGVRTAQGNFDSGNTPSARSFATGAVRGNGQFILYGGQAWFGYRAFYTELWAYDPTSNKWAWLGGGTGTDASSVGIAGTYGTKGVASPTNFPGSRTALGAVDAAGDFWIIGGYGYGSSATDTGVLDDAWKYNFGSGQWTWVAGSGLVNEARVLSAPGVYDANNTMGGRDGFALWRSGNDLYIFGGLNQFNLYGSVLDNFNDVWKISTTTGQYALVSDSNSPSTGVFGAIGVASASYIPSGRFSPAIGQDPGGNFYVISGKGYDSAATGGFIGDVWKFNPSTSEWSWIQGPKSLPLYIGVTGTKGVPSATTDPGLRINSDLFATLDDGIGIFGGMYPLYTQTSTELGFNSIYTFNSTTSQWTWKNGSSGLCGTAEYGTKGTPD
ncbi:MAG: hypothetical protein EOO39_37910, partial [Cytophagaceae bacterium]